MNIAVALIPNTDFVNWAESNRSGLAENFPVHLTIKSRFKVSQIKPVEIVNLVSTVLDTTAFNCLLKGPMYINGNLKWLECTSKSEGYNKLTLLHTQLVQRIRSSSYYLEGSSVEEYEIDGFRPHVTLQWNEHGIFKPHRKNIIEAIEANVTFVGWCLFEYSDDASRRFSKIIYEKKFNNLTKFQN